MEFRTGAPPGAGLSLGGPSIPRRGLDETLRAWSGRGQLWEALAATRDPVAERHWSAEDVRRRAHRVLLDRLAPTLASWPARRRQWVDALPAASTRVEIRSSHPVAGVSWSRTRLEGWPPRAFVARPRLRIPETLLATVARWTLDELADVALDAAPAVGDVQERARLRVETALALRELEPLASTIGVAPTRGDVAALVAEGRPWRTLAPVTDALRKLHDDATLAELALDLVAPDSQLAWRLFHLAVLGELLHALRTAGARVTSLRPLGDAGAGPAFAVVDAGGRAWDLWFEAAGAWRHYGRREPYADAAAGVRGAGGPLGTDLMLIRPDERALLIECKYSWNPTVVARGGYQQALAYAAESFELAQDLTAVVVGAEDVVQRSGWAATVVGTVGIIAPSAIPPLLEHTLAE